MSVKAMSAAFDAGDDFELPPAQRLILLRLGDWADDYGYSWPGLEDLEAKVGVGERSIRRHLRQLEDAGLVTIVYEGGGRHRTSLYRILPTILGDVDDPPGRRRYEKRHHINPDKMTGNRKRKRGHQRAEKGTPARGKPDRAMSGDPSDPLEPSSEVDFKVERKPGESWPQYLARYAALVGSEDHGGAGAVLVSRAAPPPTNEGNQE